MNRREYKIIIHIFIILLIIQQNIYTLLNLFIVILIRFLNKQIAAKYDKVKKKDNRLQIITTIKFALPHRHLYLKLNSTILQTKI